MPSIHSIIPIIGKAIINLFLSFGLLFHGQTSLPAVHSPTPIPASSFSTSSPTQDKLNQNSSSTKLNAIPTIKNSVPAKIQKITKTQKNTDSSTNKNPTVNTESRISTSSVAATFTSPLEEVAQSTVNIICTRKTSAVVATFTGSGVFLDSDGHILTNAHVGQYLLLEGKIPGSAVECKIRTGSPAVTISSSPSLIYVSPEWIQQNYKYLNDPGQGLETGENDFAILSVFSNNSSKNIFSSENSSSPYSFIPLPASSTGFEKYFTPSSGQAVTIMGYPVNNQSIQSLMSSLPETQEKLTLSSVLDSTILKTEPGSIGQIGLSGSPIATVDGLVGIVTSILSSTDPNKNYIQGITLAHINNSLIKNTGQDLQAYLKNSSAQTTFANQTEPGLASLLLTNF
ncbi:MAG: serine protease [Candidatus Pacebacteria bacterium]|nr:serine protease [Candidatus Paceibacterota bacterium]